MKILILTFYYPPDLSAGSFRTKALVNSLLQNTQENVTITVLTTQPSRYNSFSPQASALEHNGPVTIKRIPVASCGSGVLAQAALFAQYARGVTQAIKAQEYDLVFATSSRMMTATLGAWVAKKVHAKLFLDLRDLLTDTLPDLLPSPLGTSAAWFFRHIERWTVKQAYSVNLASPGFVTYFKSRYPNKPITVYTNGVDDIFIENSVTVERNTQRHINILYAGNIGTGQGLHHIIPQLANRLSCKAKFVIVGGGSAVKPLKLALAQQDVKNVEIIEPMKRTELLAHYQKADVLFLHLNDLPSLRNVIPSKLFEYAATQKPILGGLSGYSAKFASEHISNVGIFSPCDVDSALTALDNLHIGTTDRRDFVNKFSRKYIVKNMALDLLKMRKATKQTTKA
ncbi:putative glycosyl transferase [compost metagenome]